MYFLSFVFTKAFTLTGESYRDNFFSSLKFFVYVQVVNISLWGTDSSLQGANSLQCVYTYCLVLENYVAKENYEELYNYRTKNIVMETSYISLQCAICIAELQETITITKTITKYVQNYRITEYYKELWNYRIL